MSPRDFAQTRADIIKGRRRAERALTEAIIDYEGDAGEEADDGVWFDLVVATAHGILADPATFPHAEDVAREFLRTQVGRIPQDLVPYLGENGWVQ